MPFGELDDPSLLPIAVALGGLGLLILLPWRGGTSAWIGAGLLSCSVAGFAVHLVGGIPDFSNPSAWAVGILGTLAVAAAVATVVGLDGRVQLAGNAAVVIVASVLVVAGGGWLLGAACLLVNGAVVARSLLWMASGSGKRSEPARRGGERLLAVLASSAVVAALCVLADRVTPIVDRSAASPSTDGLHGALVSAGTLLLVGLAVIGTTFPRRPSSNSSVAPVSEGEP